MKRVYLVGNAHIDPVWLWRKGDGVGEVLATFRSVLDRMKEFPDFVFTAACAAYYDWVECIDPAMFSEIVQRVEEGRWTLAGGYWIQPDCNLPSGEAFARQALYSQRYFMQRFGRMARVGYSVDAFGHNGMLPQLLRLSGMDAYVFQRPELHENPNLPDNLFIWQAPDGSRVATARILHGYLDMAPEAYEDTPHAGREPLQAKALLLRDRAVGGGQPQLCFYGIGNHGGGPSIKGLESLRQLVPQYPDMAYAAPDALFCGLEESGVELCTVQGDLQHHASGCYSANAALKAANRRAEHALVAAEKLDWLAHRLVGGALASATLEAAWKKLLFNQFHDILAGCCIQSASDDALRAMHGVRDEADEIAMLAMRRIAWNVGTTRVLDNAPAQKNGWILWEKEGEGAPVVIFNPHSFPVRCAVRVKVDAAGVADAQGHPLPCQRVRGEHINKEDGYDSLFVAELPPLGYTTAYLYREQSLCAAAPGPLYADDTCLENAHVRLEFNAALGCVSRFYDKSSRCELTPGRLAEALVIDDEAADTWAHGIFRFDKEAGRFGQAQVYCVERGPLRAAVCIKTCYGRSTLVQTFYLTAGDPFVEVHCRLDFREEHRIVKLVFPMAGEDSVVTGSMPYGFEPKPDDGLEQITHQWVVMAGQNSRTGLALLNDCKYSFSAQEGELRMLVARSALYADHYGLRDGQGEFLDLGIHTFRYALCACREGGIADVVRRAELLNREPDVVMETHHTGALPNTCAGIVISAENVLCQCVKRAEDGDGTIVRLYETAGRAVRCRVELPAAGLGAELAFRPQEIKTVRVDADGRWSETNFIETR